MKTSPNLSKVEFNIPNDDRRKNSPNGNKMKDIKNRNSPVNTTKTITNLIGIDIGGSHITASTIDFDTNRLNSESIQCHKIDAGAPANQVICSWADAIRNTSENIPNMYVGIAMPGPFDYENGISYMQNQHKYDQLYRKNVKQLLADELKILPSHFHFINDAASFLLGEMTGGSGMEYQSALGITLGTGLGSAIYNSGTVKDASLWQMPFKESIAEDYISTRWLCSRFRALNGNSVKDVKEIVEQYPGHSDTVQLFEEFAGNLSDFIKKFLEKTSPEIIIIGGNITKAGDYFLEELRYRLEISNSAIAVKTSFLGEKATILGAVQEWRKILNNN